MRRRVEQHVPATEAARQLKLGPGGLRDVEFSVQLLQLVHGRADEALRSGTTLEALAALSDGGYVGRDDAAVLEESYRLLRTLEHRIQLFRLRRTHLMPTDEADLRRLGRAVGHRRDAAKEVVAQWQAQAREVRRIHERLVLPAAADRRRPAEQRGGAADPRGRTRAPGRARFPRPRRRDAAHRGAHRRCQPSRRDPAHAAAGDARLVRRRGRPRRRAALLPHHQRVPRHHPLVPQDAARRGQRRRAARARAGPQPLRRRPPDPRAGVGGHPRRPRGPEPAPARGAGGHHGGGDPAQGVRRRRDDGGARGPPPGAVPRRRRGPDRCAGPHRGRLRPHRPHRRHAAGGPRHRRARGRGRPWPARGPACWWSAWAGWGAPRWATPATPTCSSCTSPTPGPTTRRRSRAPRWSSRRCAGCSGPPARTRSSAWTPTCGPRARTGRWCARCSPTVPTTRAGRWSGRPRRCCGPRRSRGTPTWAGSSSTWSTR